jgi:hypothetical protein
MELDKLSEGICKTGFVLENRIATNLKQTGWTVISNKYYEDDFTSSVREIDLLAYKVSKVQHFNVFTTLLISCKKNESNAWALLARDINLKDPNSDWWPLHAWSNDKAIQYQLAQAGCGKTYHEELAELGVTEALSIPDVEVFAFQEMNCESGLPKNDTNIFNAVTSLMKAQAYELSALPQRKKKPAIYQFNLISINDSDLVRLKFNDESIKPELRNSEHYIARYIIRKSESFSRIRFVKASHFKDTLADYDRLHNANCKWFYNTYNRFYDGVVKDSKRIKVYLDDFRDKVSWALNEKLLEKFGKNIQSTDVNLEWNSEKNILSVTLPTYDTSIYEFLNNDEHSTKIVANALKKIYLYYGEFNFRDYWDIDFPF